jgi:uncharacterized membrane protein
MQYNKGRKYVGGFTYMATKSKKMKRIPLYCCLIVLLASIFTIISGFLDYAVVDAGIMKVSYTGWDLAFGHKEVLGKVEITHFAFSFMNLLPFVLSLVAFFLVVVNLGDKKPSVLAILTASVCLVVAGILSFFSLQFAGMNETMKEGLELGYGAILCGIVSIVSGAIGLIGGFLNR